MTLTMQLKSPTAKRRGNHYTKSPLLPVFCNDGNFFEDFGMFSGYFNGSSVIVDDSEEINVLYTMGFFGKASLSKGFPNFRQHKKEEPILLKEYQWKRRKEWSDKLEKLISGFNLVKTNTENTLEKNNTNETKMEVSQSDLTNASNCTKDDGDDQDMAKPIEINLSISESHSFSEFAVDTKKDVLVINHNHDDDDSFLNLNPHIEVEPFETVMEVLYLTLEEAFFLTFALGCLQILDLTGKPLSLLQVWRLFKASQTDFIENYVTYHYFRSKGWVVKSGIKFGGQFLLYKGGPANYHASYIVLIDNIIKSNDGSIKNREGQLTWNRMNNLNRMAETCNKEILVCKVQWPVMSEEEKENPLMLKKFKVQEFLLRRWQPCQEKEIKE